MILSVASRLIQALGLKSRRRSLLSSLRMLMVKCLTQLLILHAKECSQDSGQQIFKSSITEFHRGMVPVGSLRVFEKKLQVACPDHWLNIQELQLSGKKRMDAAAFLNGMKDIAYYECQEGSELIINF